VTSVEKGRGGGCLLMGTVIWGDKRKTKKAYGKMLRGGGEGGPDKRRKRRARKCNAEGMQFLVSSHFGG